ncbi:hypothetical protein K432DRAFT_386531 [Lepidopterella palustris CBS 459.81]|uniref:Uncharacterized protein n=1 Tax=Lepidopterella palustris CBS 459.81 TaxID=1314670 RepID=A0A8E2E056_9PEZI|nr:hypothetical protein K432DRAFT_386531 [Lepidopterella palustris CBS 459.81]
MAQVSHVVWFCHECGNGPKLTSDILCGSCQHTLCRVCPPKLVPNETGPEQSLPLQKSIWQCCKCTTMIENFQGCYFCGHPKCQFCFGEEEIRRGPPKSPSQPQLPERDAAWYRVGPPRLVSKETGPEQPLPLQKSIWQCCKCTTMIENFQGCYFCGHPKCQFCFGEEEIRLGPPTSPPQPQLPERNDAWYCCYCDGGYPKSVKRCLCGHSRCDSCYVKMETKKEREWICCTCAIGSTDPRISCDSCKHERCSNCCYP